ncbi:MAG: sugar ABC transporter permease [Lachnospiraceae bacterium]|jgi:arabinogalactan oligomer/maltooligosaccharide transport system permease protein|nr:sugar ABC transporter permease [Lachnospiraceae bacterium]
MENVKFSDAIKKGNWKTRLSILISGFGNITRKQYIKGIMFLAIQVLFWVFFIRFGIQYIQDLGTLGTSTLNQVWNEADQIYINTPGDNSMLILLYSIFVIAIAVVATFLHIVGIKSAYTAQVAIENGGKPKTFKQDLKDLFDKNMHTTMLGLPSVGVLAFTVLPIIFMICLAFTNFDRNHQPPGNLFTWVGLQNFKDVFYSNASKSHTFTRILGWTIIWAIFSTFLNYLFGMIVALMINKKGIRLKSVWRTCFVIAIAVPGFVTLLFMSKLLADMGPVNTLLQNWGLIDSPVKFLTDPLLAKITVIVVNLWIGIPYTMLITSGILMNIPADLYEAARIDGAGPVKQFMKITLPYMLAVTTPYLITQFIGNINNFNAIYFLTQGAPLTTDYYQAGKTDLLVTWLYKLTVTYQDYNLASVIGIITFLVCSIIALATYNVTATKQKEEMFG